MINWSGIPYAIANGVKYLVLGLSAVITFTAPIWFAMGLVGWL